jgi:polyisoprenoid-binding protein YceI
MRRRVAGWRLAMWLAALAWFGPAPHAQAASLYRIDQRYGSIEFSVSALGMFDVQGRFQRFTGELLLDPEHPEHTRIDVTIDASAVEMPSPDQTDLLRSAAYFDVVDYPTDRFVSASIRALSPSHYLIRGTLQVRGVSEAQVLDAVLQDRQLDEKRGLETADFVVTGEIKRSAFGMVADRTMLSDTVRLHIRIRLTVDPATYGR